MTTQDAITLAWNLANNPLAQMAFLGLLGLFVTYLVKTFPGPAQAVADYSELAEKAVHAAEVSGLKGAGKAKYALDWLQEQLAQRGIKGDAASVTLDRFKRDLEGIVARLFPKKAA